MSEIKIIESEGQKMVKVTINNETVRAEAGALHYMRGQIEMTSKLPSVGGIFKGMLTGETLFKPTYKGTGEVYFGPPNFGEYFILDLNQESWVLDKGAYVCSDTSIEVGAFVNKAISGFLGGEGFFQTKVTGTGQVVVAAGGKVERIDLSAGETLSVDGSFAVARQASVDFSIKRASKSIFGSMTSGEGLLNIFKGPGCIYLVPVPNIYNSLIDKMSPINALQGGKAKSKRGGCVGLIIFGLITFIPIMLMILFALF